MTTHISHTPIYKDESRMFYIALTFCIVLFGAYMYLLSESVMHVVMRKEIDREISATGTKVSTLEAEYIELQHSISSEIASHEGYVVVEEKIFIDKHSGSLVINRN